MGGSMAEQVENTVGNANAGHVVVHIEQHRARELSFSFERPQSRVGVGASIGTHIIFFALAVFVATYGPTPLVSTPDNPDRLPANIVWLSQPGPGGGGGGGGNRMPDPPKKAEVPGKQPVSVPIAKPELKPLPKLEEPKDPMMNIPAKTMGDTVQMNPGLLEAMTASLPSQGSGSLGGGGTGEGTGIGPGRGAGLGPGEGGGVGGGAYRPGNGVELPRVIQEIRPNYTADAMRAKVQGTVWVECVVMTDGTVGEAHVTKSLDSVFGLDQEALKAAKRWRFIPGRRLGQPVPVLVTIELTFTLR
jgi:periplasmic protein TonB